MKEFFAFVLFLQIVFSHYCGVYIKLGGYYLTKAQNEQVKMGLQNASGTAKIKTYKITVTEVNTTKDPSFKKPVKSGQLVSKFGNRRKRLHAGIDLAASRGTPIYTIAPGIVTFCGHRGGYGQFIIILHENGMISRYGHCSKIMVKRGQRIETNTQIGKVGATGNARGSHLHFEVMRNGKFLDSGKLLRYY